MSILRTTIQKSHSALELRRTSSPEIRIMGKEMTETEQKLEGWSGISWAGDDCAPDRKDSRRHSNRHIVIAY